MAYWVSEACEAFSNGRMLGEIARCAAGAWRRQTTNSFFDHGPRYHASSSLACEFSDAKRQTVGKKWFPYNKGGEFRKWYGNLDYVVDWENDGAGDSRLSEYQTTGSPVSQLRSRTTISVPASPGRIRQFVLLRVAYSIAGAMFDIAGSSSFPSMQRSMSHRCSLRCSNSGVVEIHAS